MKELHTYSPALMQSQSGTPPPTMPSPFTGPTDGSLHVRELKSEVASAKPGGAGQNWML